jgi:TPP-dependent 2-oxoacid decarboxylase
MSIRFKENVLLVLIIGFSVGCYADTNNNETPAEKNIIVLEPDSIKIADIQVSTLEPKVLTYLISAPGEVIPNANLTTKITTRIPAQVMLKQAKPSLIYQVWIWQKHKGIYC